MSVATTFGRSIVLALVPALLLTASPAQARGGYQFESDDESVVLSDIRLDTWYEGSVFTVELTITPTNEELDALRENGSHVDLEFTFYELDVLGDEPDYTTDASGYVRYIDDEFEPGSPPVVRMLGFNLARWNPDQEERELTVTVEVYGQTDRNFPLVAVDLMSTTWWPEDGDCTVMPEVIDNRGNELCAEYGPRAQLVDRYGERRF